MRPLIGLLTCTCLAAAAWAQGTIDFNNSAAFATAGDRLIRTVAGQRLVGTQWAAQLYYGTQGTPVGSLVAVASDPARFRVANTSIPGTWSGGTRTLTGFTFWQTATLQVRVWDLSRFPSYEASIAAGGWQGASSPFAYTVPPAGSPPAAFFMENFRGFAFTVPEPSAIGLAALGGIGLWCLRRRREPLRLDPGPL